MTATLEELKAKLYTQFDTVVGIADSYRNGSDERAQNRIAAAEIAKAIVSVETRLDERKERDSGMKLPGKG